MAYSLETLPGLYEDQSTLLLEAFHSSPRLVENSSSVRPGASLRTTTFNLDAEDLLVTPFILIVRGFSVLEGAGNTPFALGPLIGLTIDIGRGGAGVDILAILLSAFTIFIAYFFT